MSVSHSSSVIILCFWLGGAVLKLSLVFILADLFNLRGSDVECNPVALAFAIITRDRATLYVDSCKITAEVVKSESYNFLC